MQPTTNMENGCVFGLPKGVLSILANMERHKDNIKWNITDSSQNSFTLSLTWRFKRNKTMKWGMWFKLPPTIEELDQKLNNKQDFIIPDQNDGGILPDQIPGITVPNERPYMGNGHISNHHMPMGPPDVVNMTKPTTATIGTQTNITLHVPLTNQESESQQPSSQPDMISVSTQANVPLRKETISYVDNYDTKLSRSMSFRNKPDIDKPKDKASKMIRSQSFRNNFKLLQWIMPSPHNKSDRSPSRLSNQSIQSDSEIAFRSPSKSRSPYDDQYWSPGYSERDRIRSSSSSSVHSMPVGRTPTPGQTPTPRGKPPPNYHSLRPTSSASSLKQKHKSNYNTSHIRPRSATPTPGHRRHKSWGENNQEFTPSAMQDLSRISVPLDNPRGVTPNSEVCTPEAWGSTPHSRGNSTRKSHNDNPIDKEDKLYSYPRSPVPGRVPKNKRVSPPHEIPPIPPLPPNFKLDDDRSYLSDSTESIVDLKDGTRHRRKKINVGKCIQACDGILSSDV